MGEMLPLSTEDGHALARYRAAPQGKLRGALVIIQEIFGVNSHIKRVTDGFAADGYVALAPAIFDRAERDFPGARPISRSRPTTGRRCPPRTRTCRCTSIRPVTASTATNGGTITSPAPRWRAPGRWTFSTSTWGRRSGPC